MSLISRVHYRLRLDWHILTVVFALVYSCPVSSVMSSCSSWWRAHFSVCALLRDVVCVLVALMRVVFVLCMLVVSLVAIASSISCDSRHRSDRLPRCLQCRRFVVAPWVGEYTSCLIGLPFQLKAVHIPYGIRVSIVPRNVVWLWFANFVLCLPISV